MRAGGQALHVMAGRWLSGLAGPPCFRTGNQFAHLFDWDRQRLRETARRLGVERVVIHERPHEVPHVDLCGRPLARALAEAEEGRLG